MLALRESPYPTGHSALDAALRHAADNPELAFYKLRNTATSTVRRSAALLIVASVALALFLSFIADSGWL